MDAKEKRAHPYCGGAWGEAVRKTDEVAAEGAGVGDPEGRGEARVEPHDGGAVCGGGWLTDVSRAGAAVGAGGAGGLAGRPAAPLLRQCRRGAPGPEARAHGLTIILWTIQRACAPLRQALGAKARFETPSGRQMLVDFGELRVPVVGRAGRVFLFVATLGHSRRLFVRSLRHERQSARIEGVESALRHFGGVPAEVLLDNAKALVTPPRRSTREVTFHGRLLALAGY